MGGASRRKGQQKEAAVSPSSTASERPAWLTRYGWLIPLLLALTVNANVLLNGFIWDDRLFFAEQSFQTQQPNTPRPTPYYRPFITWSYQLDQWIWGLHPFGFHFSVYLAHALTTLLVYLTISQLTQLCQKQSAIALLTASLFAVHPIHAEAVAWISGRNDVFMALFMMLALYAYLRYQLEPTSWLYLSLFILGAALGLLSKETAIPFLLIFPVLDLLFHRAGAIRWRGIKDPMIWVWIVGLGSFILYRLTQVWTPIPWEAGTLQLGIGITTVLKTLGYYLKLLLIPHPLNLFVAELPSGNVQALIHLTAGGGGALVLVWIILRKRASLSAIGAAWFLLGMAAPLVVPFTPVTVTPVAERYAYLASGGFLLFLSVWFFENWQWTRDHLDWQFNPRWVIGCMVLIVGLFSYLTVQRNAVWRDEAALWQDTIQKSPQAALPHYNLGNVYKSQGRVNEAIQKYKEVSKLMPNSPRAHDTLGEIYINLGRFEEAIHEYEAVITLQPGNFDAHNNLGMVYKDLGRLEEALQEFQKALTLNPDLAEAYNNLGITYVSLSRIEEAKIHFEKAIKLHPNLAEAHHNLGVIYYKQNRLEEAIKEFLAAIKINPIFVKAYKNLAAVYVQKGQVALARERLEQALKIKPDFLPARQALEALPK